MNIKAFAADPLAFFDALIIPSAHGPRPFASVMAEHQRIWFRAIAPSLLAVADGKRPPVGRFWTERTKGGSKDSDAACVLLWLLAFSRHKLDMQVGAADRDQALELKKAAADIVRLNEWLGRRVEVLAWSLLCKATGSECSIVAADVAGSHGARPDIVVLNELSHVTKEEFAQNLLDNATKKPNGLVIVATNAGFTGTWQHSWREMARQSDRWHFDRFAQPAPWLSAEEVGEAERRNSRSRFNRLFWGEWVRNQGDALDEADIQACIDAEAGPMSRKSKGWFFVGGLDLGIKHDHSALVIVAGRHDTQQLRLAYAESWAPDSKTRQVDLMKVESTILAMNKRYNFYTVGYDPYQSLLLAQRCSRQHVRMEEVPFVGKNLDNMASTLLEVFRSRRIQLYDHKKLIADLGRLTITERSYGYKLEAVSDRNGHADLATALAIALPLAIEKSGRKPVRFGIGFDLQKDEYNSPFSQLMATFERRAEAYEAEMTRLAQGGSDPSDNEGWNHVMRRIRRP